MVEINRRQLLAGGLGIAGGSLLLGACGGDKSDPAAPRAAVKGPAYVPYQVGKPDLPANEEFGVPAGYFHYPADPETFITGEVGDGGELSALLQAASIAVREEKNKRWQALNEALNVDLEFIIATSVDYTDKLQVTLASGDLPDLAQITGVPQLPRLLDSEFTDLSDYVTGDAVKEYPALAAIPPLAWKIPMVNGRIFGVPQPRPSAGRICSVRGDLLDDLGLQQPDIANGQDFLDFCSEISDPGRGRWAIGSVPTSWTLPLVLEMMGAPNGWVEEGGKFTSQYESEQMPEAIEVVRQMWEDDLLHPDSFGQPAANATWWEGGNTVLYIQDFTGWSAYAKKFGPSVGIVTAPKWEGGGVAPKQLGPGGYGAFVAFKKADEKRTLELLRIANYLAAPFGTKEHLIANYGVEGFDYELDGSDPVTTDRGTSEALPIGYVSSTVSVNLYVAGQPDTVRAEHEYLSTVLPNGVPNPTQGLYSETSQTKGGTAAEALVTLQGEIIQGRRKVSDWAGAVDEWRRTAGDQMRAEFEAAFEKAAK